MSSSGAKTLPQRAIEPVKRPKRRSKWGSLLLILGIGLLVTGLGLSGYVAWEMFGTSIGSQRDYQNQVNDMERQWAEDLPPIDPRVEAAAVEQAQQSGNGSVVARGFAILRIPDFGANWQVPILAGIDTATLKHGVGWYPQSALPGEIGNFVIAGHRITNGEPFKNLLKLPKGALVIVETADTVYTYQLLDSPKNLTVQETESWIMLPNPFDRTSVATRAIATLITCTDLFHSSNRSVGFAELIKTEPKSS
ncbi:MAG: class E sortase [Propionibacteriaceae bacterium]|jgi:sortase A|nr:class E sortase [Propionibacteriaceae bacterium]